MNKGIFKEIKITDIHPFEGNPFKVREDGSLSEMVESIRLFGLINPVSVRERDEGGGYELIARQRRLKAMKMAGMKNVPAFVLSLNRQEAVIALVDSNIQRENLLPSEKAFAYKMKLEAMKHQGMRVDLTSSQLVTKLRSDEETAKGFGISRMTVQRYIRLTELIPEILKMVDDKQIAMSPAVELSHLTKEEQKNLFVTMESEQATPSHSQAIRMKELSRKGLLDMDTIFEIMSEEKGNQKEMIKLPMERIRKYFRKDATPKQIEETIIMLLERERKRRLEKSR